MRHLNLICVAAYDNDCVRNLLERFDQFIVAQAQWAWLEAQYTFPPCVRSPTKVSHSRRFS